jgi:hypothetical protein
MKNNYKKNFLLATAKKKHQDFCKLPTRLSKQLTNGVLERQFSYLKNETTSYPKSQKYCL